jgi:nitroreductase/NAD-dependent dihydropyrimidine dehydrogenase PreA subunit
MEALFRIDSDACNRDGICKKACPVDVIDILPDGTPHPSDDAENICIRCGHCLAVCPTGSFYHRDMDRDNCPPVRSEPRLTPEQCECFLRQRRSIRAYKEKPVPRDLLQKLIEMARYAPTGHNSQKVNWRVYGNREELKLFSSLTVDWMRWVMEMLPERAAELHFERRVKQFESGVDGILRGAPILIVAHGEKETPALPPGYVPEMDNQAAPPDYAIALTYLELAATSLGLGTCWAGYVYKAANLYPPMHKALDLPEGYQCFGAMMVGYSKFSYKLMPLRNPPVISWKL